MLRRVFEIISPRNKRRMLANLVLRLGLVIFDLAGIALIGLSVSIATGSLSRSNLLDSLYIPIEQVLLTVNSYAIFAAFGVGFFVIKALLSLWLNRATGNLIASIETSVSDEIFRKLMLTKDNVTREFSDQKIIYALHYSTEMAFGRLFYSASILLGESVLILLVAGYLAFVNFFLFLALVAFFAALVTVLYLTSSKKSSRISRKFDALQISSNTITQDALNIQNQLRFSKESESYFQKFSQTRNALAIANARIAELSVYPRYVLEIAMMIAILLVAAQRLVFSDTEVEIGQLSVFLAGSFRILASLLPLQGSLNMLKQITETGKASVELLEKLRDEPDFTGKKNSEHPSVLFSEVSILARGHKNALVQRFSDEVTFGSTVGIVGPSGSGKTSLVESILGIRKPDFGRIFIGDMQREDTGEQSGSLSYCPQKVFLLHGSLLENLTFTSKHSEIDWAHLDRVIQDVGLGPVIDRLPFGLETEVGTDSHGFSGGEIQRIGICRAIYQKPQVLVLDEPSSALDSSSAKAIFETIVRLSERMTIFVVTHNPLTLDYCDKVYNFNEIGDISIELGNKERGR